MKGGLMMKRKIFLAFAHPDDESFITGGTIADLHHKGVEIHLYCATKGGAGKAGSPPLCSLEDLPAIRTIELQHACEILGVVHLFLRDFQDGNLMNEPDLQQDLYRAIANVEPDVVITFAPHGISGHLDHIHRFGG
jgi:N-acetylglucosamine malate deacetylase 2